MTSTFLIRDPARSIPSCYRLDPGVTLEEIGREAMTRRSTLPARVAARCAPRARPHRAVRRKPALP